MQQVCLSSLFLAKDAVDVSLPSLQRDSHLTILIYATGSNHREGLSLLIRSVSYGPLLPLSRKGAGTPAPKSSQHLSREQGYAQRILPRPLLDIVRSRKRVAQVMLSVEGVSAYVLSSLPDLVNSGLTPAGPMSPVQPATGLGVSRQQEVHVSSATQVRRTRLPRCHVPFST